MNRTTVDDRRAALGVLWYLKVPCCNYPCAETLMCMNYGCVDILDGYGQVWTCDAGTPCLLIQTDIVKQDPEKTRYRFLLPNGMLVETHLTKEHFANCFELVAESFSTKDVIHGS